MITYLKCDKCALSKKSKCFSGIGNKNSEVLIILLNANDINTTLKAKTVIDRLLIQNKINPKNTYFTFALKSNYKFDKEINSTFLKICTNTHLLEEIKEINPKAILIFGIKGAYLFGSKYVNGTLYYDDNFKTYIALTHNIYDYVNLVGGSLKNQYLSDYNNIINQVSKIIRNEISIKVIKPKVNIIETKEELKNLDNVLNDEIAIDLETSGLNFLTDEILAIGVSDKDNTFGIIFDEDFISDINEILSKRNLIFHNGKFDLKFLKKAGIDVIDNLVFDTQLAYYTLTSGYNEPTNLEALSLKFLHTKLTKGTIDFNKVDLTNIKNYANYAGNDAYMTYKIYTILKPEILKNYEFLYYTAILPTTKWLCEAEFTGILIDKDFIIKKIKETENLIKELEHKIINNEKVLQFCKINNLETFNLNSPIQLKNLLEYLYKDKIKNTSKETLEYLYEKIKDNLLYDILLYKSSYKSYSTYFENLLKFSYDNCIHTEYSQITTATGRLSSRNPNLQNITKRGLYAKDLRNAFISRKGYSLIQADYKAAELRVLSHYAQDEVLINMLNNNQDIHKQIASLSYKKSIEDITDEERSIAKSVIFGLLYGRGINSIAQQFNLSLYEANQIKNKIFSTLNKSSLWLQRVQNFANNFGYIKTLFGRKIILPLIYSKNKNEKQYALRCAVNYPVQSAAADLTNVAGYLLYKYFKDNNYDAKVLLNIHDALVIEANDNIINDVISIIKKIMIEEVQKISKLRVKLDVDISIGKTLNL